jgi:phosphate transport system substrate-binding protein
VHALATKPSNYKNMKSYKSTLAILILILFANPVVFSQELSHNKVIITGVRFSYPLVEQWIAEYKKNNPDIQILIESRSTTDPANYDLLIEAYEPEDAVKRGREYLYLAKYALFPFANDKSAFAKYFAENGLTEDLIKQIYFHDIYANKQKEQALIEPHTVYTRLQKAGAPVTFANYFGFEQQQIKGKAIAGADEHLIKAVLKDSLGVSYGPLGLIYDLSTRLPLAGLAIFPVDINGNGRLGEGEKLEGNLEDVIRRLEGNPAKNLKNIPFGHIHLSIDKSSTNQEAIRFLEWIANNGKGKLHDFGFLNPDPEKSVKGKWTFGQSDNQVDIGGGK